MSFQRRKKIAFLVIGVGLAGLAGIIGVVRAPEARRAFHLMRADGYFGRQQYREAVIEYRNVLQIEASHAHAIRHLGLAHYHLGRYELALEYLRRAEKREPENLEVRLKLATIYLLGQQAKAAREAAEFVLERDAHNLEALVVWAEAAVGGEQIQATIRRLETMRAGLGADARFHLALGRLGLRTGDSRRAELAFREAITAEPDSVIAHVALGDFYLAKQDAARAESLYGRASQLAPVDSPARIRYVDFLLATKRLEEAKRALTEITEKAPDHRLAWRRRAEVALAEQNYEDCFRALDALLRKDAGDVAALLLRGRARLARRETAQAIQDLRQVLKLEPRLVAARYHLALAYLQAGNNHTARRELQETVSLAPGFTEARLRLAELNLRLGRIQPTIEDLERLVAKQPALAGGYRLLGSAYLAKGEAAKASEASRKLAAHAPQDPWGPYLLGVSLLAQGKRAEAAQHFEAALALAPGFVEPLAQLVALRVAERKLDAAISRISTQLNKAQTSARMHHLLGEIHAARGETKQAEEAYLKALQLDPNLVSGHLALGRLYAASGNYDGALAKIEASLKAGPEHPMLHMLAGVIQERKGDVPKAQRAYERALALNPRLAAAANNLAYLHLQPSGDKGRALELARAAREAAPHDPHISDTLGWALYHHGAYRTALGLLKESAGKLGDNAEVQYHLGMAAFKAGDRETARSALRVAVASPTKFTGREEAQRVLGELR